MSMSLDLSLYRNDVVVWALALGVAVVVFVCSRSGGLPGGERTIPVRIEGASCVTLADPK